MLWTQNQFLPLRGLVVLDDHKTRQVPLFPLTNLGGQQGQSYKLQVKVKSCQVLLAISNHLQCILWSQLLENLLTRQQLCENPLVHKRFLRI